MTKNPVRYHVEPFGQAWKVSPGPDSQPSSLHATKNEAITSAESLVLQHGKGEVVVHRSDGSIEVQHEIGSERRPG